MNRQQRKRLVRELVESRQLSELEELARRDKKTVGALCSLLFEQDDRVRWRTIEGLGSVAGVVASADIGSVRELLRRLEWLMNDESGGAGWHSPEAMAAILLQVPEMLDTFGAILGSHLDDAPLERGAHWAVAAISEIRPDLFADKIEHLRDSLTSADPWIRGCAVVALASLAPDSVVEFTAPLRGDAGSLEFYSRASGEMVSTTVGDLVKSVAATVRESKPGAGVW